MKDKKKTGPKSKYLKYVGETPFGVVKYLGGSIYSIECTCCKKRTLTLMGINLEIFIKRKRPYVCMGCKRKNKFIKKYLNRRFGKLVVLDEVMKNGKAHFKVKCDCGKIKIVNSFNVIDGRTRSCGCQIFDGKKVEIDGVFYRKKDLARKFNVPITRIRRNIGLGKKGKDILYWKKERLPTLSSSSKSVKKNKNLITLRRYGMKTMGDIANFFGFSHQRLYQKIASGHDIISEFKKLYKERNEKNNLL